MHNFQDQASKIMYAADKQDIFVQGSPAQYFYVLLAGKADLFRGQRKIMQMEPGTALGTETLFLPEGGYLYTARAAGEVRLAQYPCQVFLDEAFAAPSLVAKVLSSQGTALKGLWDQMDYAFGREQDHYFPGEIKSCYPGEWVIQEGDRDKSIYRIVSTEQGLEVNKQGRVLALLNQPGDFFGEMAAILDETRTAGVRSVGESVLEVYPGEQWEQLLWDYPGMSARVVDNLARRLAQTSKELADKRE